MSHWLKCLILRIILTIIANYFSSNLIIETNGNGSERNYANTSECRRGYCLLRLNDPLQTSANFAPHYSEDIEKANATNSLTNKISTWHNA